MRRNALSDFTNVRSNGKIAMKLPDDVDLVNARICSDDDDVMLVTDSGRAIRFRSSDVRVHVGRASMGVRGIKLREENKVVSMSVIRHFTSCVEDRVAYFKMRRAVAGLSDEIDNTEDDSVLDISLTQERYAEMSAAEDLI